MTVRFCLFVSSRFFLRFFVFFVVVVVGNADADAAVVFCYISFIIYC